MTTDEDLRFDTSLLGVEHAFGNLGVTREMIARFVESTGETNPLFTNEEAARESEYGGLVAPPTFCSALMSSIRRPDIKLEFGNSRLFASQAIENLAPIRPGDTLEARIKLKDVYAKTGRSGKMVFMVWEIGFTNQRHETVARVQESFVLRNR